MLNYISRRTFIWGEIQVSRKRKIVIWKSLGQTFFDLLDYVTRRSEKLLFQKKKKKKKKLEIQWWEM